MVLFSMPFFQLQTQGHMVFNFTSYGYEEAVTELVDQFLLMAVPTPPANANKFKKRQGAKATKKLERLESIGDILLP